MNYFELTESLAMFIFKLLCIVIGAWIIMNVDWVGSIIVATLGLSIVMLPFIAIYELAYMIHHKRRHPKQ